MYRTLCVATFAVLSTAAIGGPLDEPHLNIIPRTKVESDRIAAITRPATNFDAPQKYEENSAGAATVRVRPDSNAFSDPSKNLSFDKQLDFRVGNGIFRKLWVSSPSSTLASDGLGPLYNARSCQRCHIKDGRGHPPENHTDNGVSMILAVSVPADPSAGIPDIKDYLATAPEPTYGNQLQDSGLAGISAEFQMQIDYQEIEVPLSGGQTAWLRQPTYRAEELAYGPLDPNAMISPRVAPQMIGLGLIEAIPAADILANADPDDANKDGISGRANVVWSKEFDQPMLGRFGLKAGNPTIAQQTAGAFKNDIGISTPLFTAPAGDCTDRQEKCRTAPHGDNDTRAFELDQVGLDLTVFYSRNLGVPARRDVSDEQVLRGKEVFYQTGCTGCHQPSFVTHRLNDRPEQSFQLIWPYSDLLLHDMGPGLADNRPESRATGQEWRTPPLWGIGLTQRVSGHTYFLHDGRARNLLEAVLWHGGEAQSQRDAVVTMPAQDREDLIRFLESL